MPRRRRARPGRRGLAALALAALAAAPVLATEPVPEAARLLGWVRELSDPVMEGRAAGSAGGDRTIRHLAGEFRRLGLQRAGDGGTYFQAFQVLTGLRVAPGTALEATLGGISLGAFTPDAAFRPLGLSQEGQVVGEVVFAGYGISAPGLGYDDYAGLDARDRIVLVMAGEPREADPARPLQAPGGAQAAGLRSKVDNGRAHGAAAVLVVAPPGREDRLEPLGVAVPAPVLALSVRREVADALLGAAGLSLADVHAAVDRELRPASRLLPGVTARVRVAFEREHARTANVIGLLPGSDAALAAEAVVVGAHHDGLGRGGPTSRAPELAGTIHPGADDNASGTAALLGIAEAFTRAGAPRRSVLFVAFGAEEIGLFGSGYYVARPAVPLERTVAMVNLDSVGRLREGRLHVMGVDTGQGLRALVERAAAGLPLSLRLRGSGVGPSDHAAFLGRARPVVFFYTGFHPDYHRPSDTWDRIDADGLRTVTTLAYRVVRDLADAPVPPAFVHVPGGPSGDPAALGRASYLGVTPEPGPPGGDGLRVGRVEPGSPAERAGLRAGDTIVRLAGTAIRTGDDLEVALWDHRPGDRVEVTYVRDGRERSTEAVLAPRR